MYLATFGNRDPRNTDYNANDNADYRGIDSASLLVKSITREINCPRVGNKSISIIYVSLINTKKIVCQSLETVLVTGDKQGRRKREIGNRKCSRGMRAVAK